MAVQIIGIQNFHRMASAWVSSSFHGAADGSTGILKAMQIIGDFIFHTIRVPEFASKVHGNKHPPNTAVYYSSYSFESPKVMFGRNSLERA